MDPLRLISFPESHERQAMRSGVTCPGYPRLDASGVLHHATGRGLERTKISLTDADRQDFVDREGNSLLF